MKKKNGRRKMSRRKQTEKLEKVCEGKKIKTRQNMKIEESDFFFLFDKRGKSKTTWKENGME